MKSRGERGKPNIRGLLPCQLSGTSQYENSLKAAESNESQIFAVCSPVRSVELLNMKTCEKPRRAPKEAAAARFFDDDARNLYGAYLRNKKRKYAPHVPEAYLMVAREISGVRAKKMAQMRHFWGAAQSNKNAGVFI